MLVDLLHTLAERLGQHPPETHASDPYHGMHPAVYALVFGIISGTSLPIGAWLGIQFSPVSDKTCALMMAFGAGALLFAVTVELYGHALHEVARGRLGVLEMFTTIGGALVGAAFYLSVNKWLEEYLMHDHGDEEATKNDALEDDDEEKPMRFGAALSEAPRRSYGSTEEKVVTENAVAAELRKFRAEEMVMGKAVTEPMKGKPSRTLAHLAQKELQTVRAREKAMRAMHDPHEIQHAKSVALALFLGLLVDGVPEGVLMGFLAAEGHLTPVLIISLFVANFPEAFSSASLLIQAQMSVSKIIGMWTGLCVLVGSLGGLSCWLLLLWFPEFGTSRGSNLPLSVKLGIALVEGITGGAMIACISSVMLPEAFERAGKAGPFYTQSGFLCTSGFLLSVALKALFG